MRRLITTIVLIITPLSLLHAYELKWDMPEGQRLEMVKTATIEYRTNGNLARVYQERNIIDLTSLGKEKLGNKVKGVFSTYSRDRSEDTFKLESRHQSIFHITEKGTFVLPEKALMPNLRDIPVFPEKDVSVGETWQANGAMVISEFSRPFKLTFPVTYKLVSTYEEENGDTVAVINYEYMIDTTTAEDKVPVDFPRKIQGTNTGTIYWNVTRNTPQDIQDRYQIGFLFLQGQSIATAQFRMNISTEHRRFDPVNEEDQKEELEKEVPDDVEVDTDERGIVVRMGDVLFDFDSARLRPEARETLAQIAAAIKKKYPEREIIVEGHTDSTGRESYNQQLSMRRARGVADFLKERSGHDRFSYRGFGSSQPRASNDSADGRAKNRRVEIIIKTK